MSRDIRSYFLPKGVQSNSKSENKQIEKSKGSGRKPHKRIYVIDSDSEEEQSPPKRSKDSGKGLKDLIKDSGKESRDIKTAKCSPKLKPVNVADAFGTNKIKRSAEKNLTKQNEHSRLNSKGALIEETHSDSDFEATLRQVDKIEAAYIEKERRKDVSPLSNHVKVNNSGLICIPKQSSPDSKEKKNKELKGSAKHTEIQPQLSPNSSDSKIEKITPKKSEQKTPSPKKEDKKRKRETSALSEEKEKKHRYESSNHKKENGKSSASLEPVAKLKNENKRNTESSSPNTSELTQMHDTPDHNRSPAVDPAEKKREHAISYMKYLQREGPKHLGSKELPRGKPGCLSSLTFVITGVLDSLERDQAANLIKEYGGRVTSGVSKKTSYLVRGDDPGTSKLDKAISFGTPQLDEDGLFKLIVERSGKMPDIQNAPKKVKDSKVKKSCEVTKDTSPIKEEEQSFGDTPVPKLPLQDKKKPIPSKLESKTDMKTSEPSLWVEKYRPSSSKQIIGQQGDRSAMRKLMTWLQNWHKNHSGNKKLQKPSPWAKNDDGAFYKAALLSGPPGVGKTTMAHVISKELGFDIVEFNASDTRSKSRLHDEVSTLLSSQSLFGYFHEGEKTSSKHVLVMDEVDGMAGNEDRGGVQELMQLIKNSQVPIICTCNDRNHPKIRSLVNYCFDLRVSKPRVEQIRGPMMSICFKEGLKIPAEAMTDMIIGTNQDLRQILNHMTMWTAKNKQLSPQEAKYESQKAKKDLKMGPWDALKNVFSAESHKTMSINDKADLFFYDYSISPLFVQENYLSVVPLRAEGKILKTLDLVAKTADSISMGDVVDRTIRKNNAWSLLPIQAMFSSVLPGDYMEGYLRAQINFPSWLGKNSRRSKLDRLLQELQVHMRLTTSASKEAINMDYLPSIRKAIFNPLIEEGTSGIPAALKVMEDYHLIREDLESIVELSTWPGDKDPTTLIDSKVKAAMTRAYNKEGFMTPYSVVSVVKKQTASSSQDLDENEETGEEAADGDESEDITHDAMIKAKKRTATKAHHKEAGSSDSNKGKGKGKGKGKKKAD